MRTFIATVSACAVSLLFVTGEAFLYRDVLVPVLPGWLLFVAMLTVVSVVPLVWWVVYQMIERP